MYMYLRHCNHIYRERARISTHLQCAIFFIVLLPDSLLFQIALTQAQLYKAFEF